MKLKYFLIPDRCVDLEQYFTMQNKCTLVPTAYLSCVFINATHCKFLLGCVTYGCQKNRNMTRIYVHLVNKLSYRYIFVDNEDLLH